MVPGSGGGGGGGASGGSGSTGTDHLLMPHSIAFLPERYL